jgi:hypothetical protein
VIAAGTMIFASMVAMIIAQIAGVGDPWDRDEDMNTSA